jgi:nitroreductase
MTRTFNDVMGVHPITIMEAIYSRRSIRDFNDEIVDSELLTTLFNAAIQAPTAMHEEPCTFCVIQDPGLLQRISHDAKQLILTKGSEQRNFSKHAFEIAQNPEFQIFYNSTTLVLICSKFRGQFAQADCWLAAQNLMLAAYAHGLGSCVIGLAVEILNTPQWKRELNIPGEVDIIAAIILGKSSHDGAQVPRKPVEILSWKSLPLEDSSS